MRLGGQVLKNFCNANDFGYGELNINEGDAATLCIQLVDYNKKLCADVEGTHYLRYMPPAGSSLKIQIHSIDDEQVVEKIATQDATDPSIWCVELLENEVLATSNIHLELTEPGPKTKKGVIIDGLLVEPVDPTDGHSFC